MRKRMEPYRPSRSPCPVGRASRVVGDRWVLLILREALLGVDRFDGFMGRLDISRATLAARLAWMVDAGVLSREPPDAKYAQYRLTDAGRALGPVVTALGEWGDAWLPRLVDA